MRRMHRGFQDLGYMRGGNVRGFRGIWRIQKAHEPPLPCSPLGRPGYHLLINRGASGQRRLGDPHTDTETWRPTHKKLPW